MPGIYEHMNNFLNLANWRSIGEGIVDLILSVANLLREDWAPGIMVGVIVILFLMITIWFFISVWRTCWAIQSASDKLGNYDDPQSFAGDYPRVGQRLLEMEKEKGPKNRLGVAWREFRETLIEPVDDGGVVYNTVRPSFFFNREDLGIEEAFWRYIPTFFVSFGLLLTFLGLVAALDSTAETFKAASSNGGTDEALRVLLKVASAKFVMSLAGLFCSILFAFSLRVGARRIDRRLHDLCIKIEHRVVYRTPESLLDSIMRQSAEQTDQLKTFSTDLAAQIGRDIRNAAEHQTRGIEALGQQIQGSVANISSSIEEAVPRAIVEALDPVIQKLEEQRLEGARAIAHGLGDHLTSGVQTSMEEMQRALGEVGATLGRLAERMDSSAGNMASQVDQAVLALTAEIGRLGEMMGELTGKAVETLNEGSERLLTRMEEALQAIRSNTAASGEALAQAAASMGEAAASLAGRIEEAGQQASEQVGTSIGGVGRRVAEAMGGAVESLHAQASNFSTAFQDDLLAPLERLRNDLESLREAVTQSADGVGRYSSAVGDSAAAIEVAHGGLANVTRSLSEAVAPITESVQNMGDAQREMRRSVEETARTIQDAIARASAATVGALEALREGIRNQQQVVQGTVDALDRAVGEFNNIIDRYQTIDEQLGGAFSEIRQGVTQSVSELKRFNEELNQGFADALQRLQAVVADAEPFDGPDKG